MESNTRDLLGRFYSENIRSRKTWHADFNPRHCDDNLAFYIMQGMLPLERTCNRSRQVIESAMARELSQHVAKGSR